MMGFVQEVTGAEHLDPQHGGERANRRAAGRRRRGVAAQQAHGVDSEPGQHVASGEPAKKRQHQRTRGIDGPVAESQQ
jgi:hypothetical protein